MNYWKFNIDLFHLNIRCFYEKFIEMFPRFRDSIFYDFKKSLYCINEEISIEKVSYILIFMKKIS